MNGHPRILLIDHRDSFVHILAEQFRCRGCAVDIRRSGAALLERIQGKDRPDLVVLSPGPGHPDDHGPTLQLLRDAPPSLPVFGVCLGHQCIISAVGGRVERGDETVHGRFSRCRHAGTGLFRGLPDPLQVGRYHSLVGRAVPDDLLIDARVDGVIMAVHHRERPWFGVQFHPESILTPFGGLLIDNLLETLEVRHAA